MLPVRGRMETCPAMIAPDAVPDIPVSLPRFACFVFGLCPVPNPCGDGRVVLYKKPAHFCFARFADPQGRGLGAIAMHKGMSGPVRRACPRGRGRAGRLDGASASPDEIATVSRADRPAKFATDPSAPTVGAAPVRPPNRELLLRLQRRGRPNMAPMSSADASSAAANASPRAPANSATGASATST